MGPMLSLNEDTASATQTDQVTLPDLSALPGRQRIAVKLRYTDDLSFEEIAKRLDTTPGNARQIVSRALRSLKSLLGKVEDAK